MESKKTIDHLKKTSFQECDNKRMFEEQTKLFSDNASKLDYRNLNDEQGVFLGNYIHKPLFNLFERILDIKSSNEEKGKELETRKKFQYLKLVMRISIFCNTKNRYTLIMQTIIGLSVYPYGLRDSDFLMLNRFGLSCSINTIRKMAKVSGFHVPRFEKSMSNVLSLLKFYLMHTCIPRFTFCINGSWFNWYFSYMDK